MGTFKQVQITFKIIRKHEHKYVLLNGRYSTRGGNDEKLKCVIIFNGLPPTGSIIWMDTYLGEGTYLIKKLFSFSKRKKYAGSIIL